MEKIKIGSVKEILKNPPQVKVEDLDDQRPFGFNMGALREKKEKSSYRPYAQKSFDDDYVPTPKRQKNGSKGMSLFSATLMAAAGFFLFVQAVSAFTGKEFSFKNLIPNFAIEKVVSSEPKEITDVVLPVNSEIDETVKETATRTINKENTAQSFLPDLKDGEKVKTSSSVDGDQIVKQYQMNYATWKEEKGIANNGVNTTTTAKLGENTVVAQMVVSDERGERVYVSRGQAGSTSNTEVWVEEKLAVKNTANSKGVITNDLSYYEN